MVVVYTEPFPVISAALLAVLLMAIFFVTRISLSYHFMTTILGRSPLILIIGPPNSGKKRIMEKLSPNVQTKAYPLVGTFRTCDISLNGKIFRVVSFYSMKDYYTPKKDSIKLIRKRPRLVIFMAKGTSDKHSAEKQYNAFREVRQLFFDAPGAAAVDKSESTGAMRDIFNKDLMEVQLSRKGDVTHLENAVKKLLFAKAR